MDTPYNVLYNVGDVLIIELKTLEIFEGRYNDGGRNRIDLVDVKQHNNLNQLGGVYSFYRNEIINIYRPKNKEIKKQEKNYVMPTECIQVVEEEYNRIKEMCRSAVYLQQIDDRYFNAVEELNEAETIGVVPLGAGESTTDTLRLLVICTWKQIYIFDFVNLKNRKFYPEIKDILESEYITKVMHGGSALVNMLYRNYIVNVQNIFDTQIVDLILVKSKTGTCDVLSDISQCLVHYLNFPPSLLKDALLVSKKNWKEEPLTEERKFFASQLVAYLIPLKEHMKKKLLSNVYKAIDDVHNYFCNLDSYKFSQILQKNRVPKEIDSIIPKLYILNEKDESIS